MPRLEDALALHVSRVVEGFADQALRSALAVLVDANADVDDKVAAAWVVRCVLGRSSATEAMITDVAGALVHVLDAPDAIPLLATALRSRRVDRTRVGVAFTRAADRALARRRFEAVHWLVLEMLDESAWADHVRDDYGAAALGWALDGLPSRRTEALLAIGSWLLVRDGVPEWMRKEIRTRPELFAVLQPPPRVAWVLHCASPSANWVHLAGMRERETFAITRDAFPGEIENAIATLDAALDEMPEGATRVVLANWRAQLAGR